MKPGARPIAGSLPVEWQNMGALGALDLTGNALSGTLPEGLAVHPMPEPGPTHQAIQVHALVSLVQTRALLMYTAVPDHVL